MAVLSFTASIESQTLGKFLIKHAESKDYESVLTYDVLSKAAGCDVQEKRYVIVTACNIARRECNALYGVVRGEGIKLLTPVEEVGIGSAAVVSIRKKSTRTLRKMTAVKYGELPPEKKIEHDTSATILGAYRLFGTQRARDKISGAVTQATGAIPHTKLARLFCNGESSDPEET